MLTNVDMHWLITVNIQWFQVDKRSNASVLCFKYSVVSCQHMFERSGPLL